MTNEQRKSLLNLVRGRDSLSASELAEAINAESIQLKSRMITTRTVIAELGIETAGGLLAKLEVAATNAPPAVATALREIQAFLQPQGGGIDIGDPKTRLLIDGLQQVGFTADELAQVKALGETRTLDFTPTADDVINARQQLARISQQEQVHRDFTNDYQSRVAVADAVLARLNAGEVIDVVTEL